MKTIHKYTVDIADGPQAISMPVGAVARAIGLQHARICVWAEVETEQPDEVRTFYVVGTGHRLPSGYTEYLGTVQDGPFVWHVFA